MIRGGCHWSGVAAAPPPPAACTRATPPPLPILLSSTLWPCQQQTQPLLRKTQPPICRPEMVRGGRHWSGVATGPATISCERARRPSALPLLQKAPSGTALPPPPPTVQEPVVLPGAPQAWHTPLLCVSQPPAQRPRLVRGGRRWSGVAAGPATIGCCARARRTAAPPQPAVKPTLALSGAQLTCVQGAHWSGAAPAGPGWPPPAGTGCAHWRCPSFPPLLLLTTLWPGKNSPSPSLICCSLAACLR